MGRSVVVDRCGWLLRILPVLVFSALSGGLDISYVEKAYRANFENCSRWRQHKLDCRKDDSSRGRTIVRQPGSINSTHKFGHVLWLSIIPCGI
jgi:hypothetical protein